MSTVWPTLTLRPEPFNVRLVDPPAVLVMFNVAVFAPNEVGVNVTSAVVDAPAASVAVAGRPAENCAEPVPVIGNGVPSVTVKPLLLVIVTVRDAGDPFGTAPKSTGFGVAVTCAARIGTEYDALPAQPSASAAWTVKLNVAAAVGEPESTPPVESVSPVGTAPAEIENEYGDTPPLAVMVREYGVLRMPAVRFPLIVMAGQADEPARLTVRTLPAVLAIASVANLPPAASGRKPTATEVDSPPASAVVPGTPTLKSPALAPLMLNGVVSVTAAAAMLVTVTVATLLAPAGSDPKFSDVGDTAIDGVIALARFCGSLGAFSWKSAELLLVS